MKYEKEILAYCRGVWRTPTMVAAVVMGRSSSSYASPKIKALVVQGKLEKHPQRRGQYRTRES